MKNPGFKQYPNSELNDDQLNQVAAGAFDIHREKTADSVMICHRCRGTITRENGCSNCGISWEDHIGMIHSLQGE